MAEPGLRIGDYISVFSDNHFGFMSADGFADDTLHVHTMNPHDLCPPEFENCVFQLQVKLTYFAQERLDHFMKAHRVRTQDALRYLEGEKLEEAKQLQHKAAEEVARNREDAVFYAGRRVCFGQAIQLLHVKSNKYLTAIYFNASNLADEGNEVQLRLTDGSIGSYFKIQSWKGMRPEDDVCRDRDVVSIIPEAIPKISLSAQPVGPKRLDEAGRALRRDCRVVADSSQESWLLSVYRQVAAAERGKQAAAEEERGWEEAAVGRSEASQRGSVLCGQVVRLMHREAAAYLAADCDVDLTGPLREAPVVLEKVRGVELLGQLEPTDAQALGTSYSLWIVESVDPTQSPPLRYGETVRLRNLVTGGYLQTRHYKGGHEAQASLWSSVAATPAPAAKRSTLPTPLSIRPGRSGHLNSSTELASQTHGALLPQFAVFCSREKNLLHSTRTQLVLAAMRDSEEAAEGEGGQAAALEEQQVVFVQFLHLCGGHHQRAPGPTDAQTPNERSSLFSPSHHGRMPRDAGGAGEGGRGEERPGEVMESPTKFLEQFAELGDAVAKAVGGAAQWPVGGHEESGRRATLDLSAAEKTLHTEAPRSGWLHLSRAGASKHSFKLAVTGSKVEFDGWEVAPAHAEEVRDVHHVVSVRSCLQGFIERSTERRRLDTYETGEMVRLMRRMQRFLTVPARKQNEDDPASEKEVRRRQSIMLDLGMIPLLLVISELPITVAGDHTSERLEQRLERVQQSGSDSLHMRQLCHATYTLLYCLVKGNHTNGMCMAGHIETLLQPLCIPKAVGADEAEFLSVLRDLVVAIYQNNQEVLAELAREQVQATARLLAVHQGDPARQADALGMLTAMCVWEPAGAGKEEEEGAEKMGVSKNQEMVWQALLSAAQHLPVTDIREGELRVLCDAEQQGLRRSEWEWVELQRMLQQPGFTVLYNEMLRLCSALLFGNNELCEQILASLSEHRFLSYPACVAGMQSLSIPSSTRALFAAFINDAFVDAEPQQDCCTIVKLHIWERLGEMPQAHANELPPNFFDFVVLQAFCLHHLEHNDVQGQSIELDTMTLEALKLLYNLVLYGFFSQTVAKGVGNCRMYLASVVDEHDPGEQSVKHLIARAEALWASGGGEASFEAWAEKQLLARLLVQPLSLLLDCSTDAIEDRGDVDAQPTVVEDGVRTRNFLTGETDHLKTYAECKVWVCRILDLIADIRLNIRVKKTLLVFEKDLQLGKSFEESDDMQGSKCVVQREDFEEIFKIFDLEEEERLAPVLFALVANKTVNQPKVARVAVAATALPLILRVLGQRAEVLRTLRQGTQIMLDPHLIHIYHNIMAINGELHQLTRSLRSSIMQVRKLREHLEHTQQLEEKQQLLEKTTEDLEVANRLSWPSQQGGGSAVKEKGIFGSFLRRADAPGGGGVLGQLFGWQGNLAVKQRAADAPAGEASLEAAGGAHKKDAAGGAMPAGSLRQLTRTSSLTQQLRRGAGLHFGGSYLERRQQSTPVSRRERRNSDVNVTGHHTAADDDEMAIRFVSLDAGSDPKEEIPKLVDGLVQKIQQILEVTLAGHVPKWKLQNTFRNVDLHDQVLDILLAFEGEEELLHEFEQVGQLFAHSLSFLSHFAHGHTVNQGLLVRHLESMVLPSLGDDKFLGPAAETFVSIFSDNRVLCTKVEDHVFRIILALLSKEQRYVYLKCLQALCCPNGIPIKRNQMSIMKYLRMNRDREGVLELYNGAQGLEMLHHIMLNENQDLSLASRPQTHRSMWKDDGTDPPMSSREQTAVKDHDSKVMYFAHTLRLLALCCVGKNASTQRECRRWLSLHDAASIAMADWCVVDVKAAALKFIAVVHFEGAKQSPLLEAAQNPTSWELVEYFDAKFRNLVESSDVKFAVNQTAKEELEELLDLALRVICNFFDQCFQLAGSTQEQRDAAGRMCGTLIKLYAEDTLTAETSAQIAYTLGIFDRKTLGSTPSERENLKTLLKSSRMVKFMVRGDISVDHEAGATPETVLRLFPKFINDFKMRIDIPEEYHKLCQMFEQNPKAVNFLIRQLDSHHPQAKASRHLYISVLKYFWIALSRERSTKETMAILDINSLLKAIIRITSSERSREDDVFGSLQLAVSLLEHGGQVMQDKLYRELVKTQSYDFLARLQEKLAVGREEVKEMRLIVQQLITDYTATHEVGSRAKSLHELLKDAGLGELGTEVSEQSFTLVVLHFLHALCQGQNRRLQRLIGGHVHGLNLTLEVAQLVSDMEKCVDPLNIDRAIKGFRTLTGLMQGPCRPNQMALVNNTQIIRVISSLVKSPLRHPAISYPKEYTSQIWALQSAMADCLLGLLEGVSYSDPFIAERIMQDLDCEYMCSHIVRLHDDKNQQGADYKLAENVSFQYFLLLRTLADYAPAEQSPLQHMQKHSAYLHFDSQTGSIEIAQGPQLVRFYFREPAICKGISERNKELLLWNVNRESEMSRLADFFERIGDIYKEMNYGERLRRRTVFRLLRKCHVIADRVYMWNVTLLNILLLVFFKYIEPPASDPERPLWVKVIPNEPAVPLLEIDNTVKVLVKDILSVAQLLLELTLLASHLVEDTPNFVRRFIKVDLYKPFSFLDADKHLRKTRGSGRFLEAGRGFYFLARYCWFALHDNVLIWRLVACLVTIVAVATTDDHTLLQLLLFAILLLEVFQRSKSIGFVATAVLKGGWVLLLTVGMGLVFLYWFAVVGFVFFPNLFQFRKPEVVDGSTQAPWQNDRRVPCVNIWTCFLIILDQGLRKEDVGEALDKLPWPTLTNELGECERCPWEEVGKTCDMLNNCEGLWSWPQGKLWIRIAYTFLFFVLISAICLEVIFGIIIDSFKSIREEKEEIQKDIEKKCFICGISRDLFDSKASGGFELHCSEEHNMWVYMKFLIHLREKPETECNGLESFVLRKCRERDFSFFPVGRAFSLGGQRHQNKTGVQQDLEGRVRQLEAEGRQRRESVMRKVQRARKLLGSWRPLQRPHEAGASEVVNIVKEIAKRDKIHAAYSLE